MSRDILVDYGMLRIARIELPDDQTFRITLEHMDAGAWEKTIYAFLLGNEIQRIGSSKGQLAVRLRSWTRDVTAALRGQNSSTPEWEAAAWRDCLRKNGSGSVYARVATTVTTPVGTFPAYMDEESILIIRHKPPLNRHTNR